MDFTRLSCLTILWGLAMLPGWAGDGPKLIVLGIAQDAGYPQAACRKKCCLPTYEHPQKRRLVSCLGLVDGTDRWIFDATPSLPQQLYRLPAPAPGKPVLSGVFLTHAHIGHYTGLMHLGREVMGADKVPVYAMPRMFDFLKNNGPWSQLVGLNNIVLQPLQNDTTVRINKRITVTPFLVPHRDEFSETVGYRITGPNKTAIFIPDIDKWEKWSTPIESVLMEADYSFLDGTFFYQDENPSRDMSEIPHPFIEESMARFKDKIPAAKKKGIHFIHFNHTHPILNPDGKARKVVEDAGFSVAYEGETIEL